MPLVIKIYTISSFFASLQTKLLKYFKAQKVPKHEFYHVSRLLAIHLLFLLINLFFRSAYQINDSTGDSFLYFSAIFTKTSGFLKSLGSCLILSCCILAFVFSIFFSPVCRILSITGAINNKYYAKRNQPYSDNLIHTYRGSRYMQRASCK